MLFCLACAHRQTISEVQQGVIGRHQYELRLGDILKNSYIIVSVSYAFNVTITLIYILAELYSSCT